MQLFYNPDLTPSTKTFTLNREESKHVIKVLRKSEGDLLHLTDGKGNEYHGTITTANHNRCELGIAFAKAHPPLPYQLHIAIAPTKMNDRMEWFLEKATEMGISRVTPLLCDHSERKKINKERFERIVVSALKQSLQFHLPIIDDLTNFDDFIQGCDSKVKAIAHCEDQPKQTTEELFKSSKDICVMIGPEGDFSPIEIEKALNQNFKPITLGTTRLRTETAGIYTTAIAKQIWDL